MTKKNVICFCNGMSDKDFIFEVFSDKGFVADANGFLKSDRQKSSEQEAGCVEGDTQQNANACRTCL